MSSLDPCVTGVCKSGRDLTMPFKRLAALAAGEPLPSVTSFSAPSESTAQKNGIVNLSISRQPAGGAIELRIERPQKDKESKPPKDKPPPKAAKAPTPAPAPAPASSLSSSSSKSAAGSVSAGRIPFDEPPPLDAAEIAACQVPQEPISPTQARLQVELDKLGMTSAKFWRVRSDYYDQELVWRRDVLGAPSVTSLCKSMIMENTKVSDLTLEQATAAGRLKYVCICLQYAKGKLHKEKLHDHIRKMEGSKALGKKQYSLRMVSQETSDQLSGFEHNAVTPIGMATPVPVLLSHHIKSLPEAQLWLGGGEVDLKLRLDVAQFVGPGFTPGGRVVEFADVTE